jgi:hypothetical protein
VTKVALYTLENETCEPEFEGLIGCCKGDTSRDLWLQLEFIGIIEWPFQFWNSNQMYRVKTKLERLNHIGDRIYVVCCNEEGTNAETRKHTFDNAFGHLVGFGFGFGGVVFPDKPVQLGSQLDTMHLPESSRISKLDVKIPDFDFQFVLVPKGALEKYKSGYARSKKELLQMSRDDHLPVQSFFSCLQVVFQFLWSHCKVVS